MSYITESSKFYVNSRNRMSGTDSNFAYYFNIPKDSRYNKVCLLQASIPKSYYMVQEGEYFDLQEGILTANITVPPNYTRKSFAVVLQATLTTSSPNGWTYLITYPNSSTLGDTGLYTYTVSGNAGTQPTFIFSTSNDLWKHMGFNSGSTNNFTANSITSENVINLQRDST